jgi:hypothetical protein
MYCIKCGTTNNETSKFCAHCGASCSLSDNLTATVPNPVPVTAVTEQQPPEIIQEPTPEIIQEPVQVEPVQCSEFPDPTEPVVIEHSDLPVPEQPVQPFSQPMQQQFQQPLQQPQTISNNYVNHVQNPPPPPPLPIPLPPKEKHFFGKGALIFCLAIIAVLSILTGTFAGLYFEERSRSSPPSHSNYE